MADPLLDLAAELQQPEAPAANPRRSQAAAPAPQAPAPEAQSEGVIGSTITGALDTITFGTLDEISGTLATFLPGGLPGQTPFWSSGKGFADTVAANIAVERATMKADAEKHPYAYHGGQLAGAIVIPYGAGAKTAGQLAKVGAVQGAAYGAGSGENLGERAGGAVSGGLVGGAIGGVIGKAAEIVGPRVTAMFRRAKPVEKPAERAAAGFDLAEDAALVPEGSILGTTREGRLILGGSRKAPDGAAERSVLDEALPARVEAVEGEAIGPGTQVAREGQAASAGSEKAPLTDRESLKALQGFTRDMAAEMRATGNRSADITWESAPDVAARTGEWRLGNLGGPEEVPAFLRAVVEGTTSKTRKADVDLERAAFDVANRVGDEPEAILAFAQQVAGAVGKVDEVMLGLRTLWSKTSEDVTDFHLMNIDWDTASDELVAEAAQRIYNVAAISSQLQVVKTGLGRGLRSIQLPPAKAYLEDLTKVATEGVDNIPPDRSLSPLPRTRQEISDWFDLWGTTGGDPKRQGAMLQGLLTAPSASKYLRQSFANFFTASILSAPKTIALNIVGPGVISVVRNVERLSGAAYGSINPFYTAEQRAGARAVARLTGKAYVQTFTEIGDALRMALMAAERNHTIIGGGGQTMDSAATYGPITENFLRAAGMEPGYWSSKGYALGNAINFFPRGFARVNNGLDEFSKRLAYQGEVRVNAMVEAANRGLEGDEARQFVEASMKAAYDQIGHATDAGLLRSAERTTLTATVGDPGSNLRAFGNSIQRLRADIPEFRYLLPVFNVPVNALGETLRRLPIAAIPGVNKVLFERTAAELAGELGPVAQADAHGRVIMGGLILMGGYMLNKAGVLTGSGPQDPTDRRVWLTTHQPYSIKRGDQWVRYDKFDIIGGILSIPSTIHDATVYHDAKDSPDKLFFAGVGALAQWVKDRAALRNAVGLLALGDDPTKNTENVFTQMAGNIASGFYPAALRTTITDAMTNPYMPLKRSWTDYIESVLPGNQVELMRNILGEPIDKPLNTLPEAFVPVSLVKAVGYDTDPVLDELDRLYQVTGYGAGADTSSFSYGQFPDKDLKLEDGQSLYTHAMRARQEITVEGKTLRETLSDLFASPQYGQAVDGQRTGRTTSRGDVNRPFLVGEVFEKFNAAIKARLVQESPKAKSYMAAALAKTQDAAYLRDVTVEDLVNNPALWDAKGVDRAGFEARAGGRGASAQMLLDALDQNQ